MEKVLKPDRFDTEPNTPNADKIWIHWKKTFENFILALQSANTDPIQKYSVLINYVSPNVYMYISDLNSYDDAMVTLENLYVKTKSEVYARHVLATRKQNESESLDQYMQELKQLSKECNFVAVDANRNREDSIRDAFITGLRSPNIRQRLLEKQKLSMLEAFEQARSLELAQKQADSYNSSTGMLVASTSGKEKKDDTIEEQPNGNKLTDKNVSGYPDSNLNAMARNGNSRCYFCGNGRHPRQQCPAREATCLHCQKVGHYLRVCRTRKNQSNSGTEKSKNNNASNNPSSAAMMSPVLAAINRKPTSTSIPNGVQKASLIVYVNGHETLALIDSGSSDSFISLSYAKLLKLKKYHHDQSITLAATSNSACTVGFVTVNLHYHKTYLKNIKLMILDNLCADILIGHDILRKHTKLEIDFGGSNPPMKVCNLMTMDVFTSSTISKLIT